MEMEIWNVWATNRISGAIGGLSTIIAIWVAARFASVASEQSEENKTVAGKILLTLFGGSVILWGVQNTFFAIGNWSVTANAFKTMKENGLEVSNGAMRFAETYGAEPSLLNQPVSIVFFVTAFLIILYPIWFKK
ncbi:MAG: hypothetical protein ACJ0FJ_04545 [Gammaproteobacteria bacterium]|jgi:hypothetical protein|tara:strand:- start:389 stop:793 length:405 start_codon:yes stop_codon:yes gene_type:complete